jgi:hypothetical protein
MDPHFGGRTAYDLRGLATSGRLGIAYGCTNLAKYLLDDRVPWEPLPSEAQPTQSELEPPFPIGSLSPASCLAQSCS